MSKTVNILNLLQVFFPAAVFSLFFISLPFIQIIGIGSAIMLCSLLTSTILGIAYNHQTRRKSRVIKSLSVQRDALKNQRKELEDCLAEKTQTQSYADLQETDYRHVSIIEEQEREIKEMKADIEKLYTALKDIDLPTEYTDFHEGLESLSFHFRGFYNSFASSCATSIEASQDANSFHRQRMRKSSIPIHRKRLYSEGDIEDALDEVQHVKQ